MHETNSMYLSNHHVQLIGILLNATLNLDSVSMYPFCKNAREFVLRFHDEGRHEYDAECGIERLEKGIDVVMDPNNPAVAGKYFSEDYEFTRSDLPILENNLKMVQDIKTSIQKPEEDAKKKSLHSFLQSRETASRAPPPKNI